MGITNLLYKPVQAVTYGLTQAANAALFVTGGNNLINIAKYLSPVETEVSKGVIKNGNEEIHLEMRKIVSVTRPLEQDVAAAASEIPFLAAKVAIMAAIFESQNPTLFEEHYKVSFPQVIGATVNQTLSLGKEVGLSATRIVLENLPAKEAVIEFAKNQKTRGLEILQKNAANSTLTGLAALLTLSAFYDFYKMDSAVVTSETRENGKITKITQKTGFEKLLLSASGTLKLAMVAAGIAVKQTGILNEYTDYEKMQNHAYNFINTISINTP